MRLQEYEILSIKEVFSQVFKSGEIFLFGSRINDALKGGDIDLFLNPIDKTNLRAKKIEFLVDLKSKIGDQKIDVILAKDGSSLIEKEAMAKGVKL